MDGKKVPTMNPSPEQLAIIAALHSHHVIVSATAGSGKSTLAMQVFETMEHDDRAVLVTYNRALAESTKQRCISSVNADRIGVYTYHGLASILCQKVIIDDMVLSEIISAHGLGTGEAWSLRDFTLLVIDEAQDLRPMYVKLIMHLLYQVNTRPSKVRMLVMGDDQQLLYSFYNRSPADRRFLLGADRIFGSVNSIPWLHKSLSTSYRVSPPVAKVVNKLTKSDRPMVSSHTGGPPVTIFVVDMYKDAGPLVVQLVTKSKYSPEEVFILSSSLNARSPVVDVVGCLVNAGVPVHVARSGALAECVSAQSTRRGKVQLKTFCAAKGLESSFVIVLNMRPLHDLLENTQFVALTRTKSELVVLHNYRHTSHEELQGMIHGMYNKDLRIVLMRKIAALPSLRAVPPRVSFPADIEIDSLYSFIDVDDMRALLRLTEVVIMEPSIQEPDYANQMVKSFDNSQTFVDVSSLTGLALMFALEFYITQCTPVRVRHMQTTVKRSDPSTIQSAAFLSCLDECVRLMPGTKPTNRAERVDVIQRQMRAFACAALCYDTISSYADRLVAVKNQDWIVSPSVFVRFRAIVEGLDRLIESHGCTVGTLRWWAPDVGRFKVDAHPVAISCVPAIVTADGSLLVHLIHRPSTGHADVLAARAMGCIVGRDTTVFVVNVFDGSICRVDLVGSPDDFMSKSIHTKLVKDPVQSDQSFYSTYRTYTTEFMCTRPTT
jgi:hypothetical protein